MKLKPTGSLRSRIVHVRNALKRIWRALKK